ncbi:MAG: DUF3386 family protein [Pirellulales bacterium]|nr:DUF3386 family protein [Pirellulales bacterium]
MWRRSLSLAWLLLVLSAVAPARAHFIWLQGVQADGRGQIQVYFSEAPEPGSAALLDKVAQTEAWECRPEGRRPIALQKQLAGEQGSWTADVPYGPDVCYQAHCLYGVFERGGQALLLDYYAKHAGVLDAASRTQLPSVEAPLDIVGGIDAGDLVLRTVSDGQPLAAAEVIVTGPDGAVQPLTTDAAGEIRLPATAGAYAVRAQTSTPMAGTYQDKPYSAQRRYATLTFQVAAVTVAVAATDTAAGELTATELLARARAARAVWKDFPGFSADLTIRANDHSETARLTMHGDGRFDLEGSDSLGVGWTKTQLRILVQHRMPDGVLPEEAEYVAEEGRHPLGRLIKLKGGDLDSAYRVLDDVVAEVNRTMGKTRFTISVLSVTRNAEKLYLPEAFTVSYWDTEAGRLRSVETIYHTWQRVAGFDLPQRLVGVLSKDGQRHVFEVELANVRLLGEPAATQVDAATARR